MARSLFGNIRQATGQLFEDVGARLGLPEMGISERIAGGPTPQRFNIARGAESTQPQASLLPGARSAYTPPTPTFTGGGGGQQSFGQPAGQPPGQPQGQPQEGAPAGVDTSGIEALIQPALDTLAGLEAETRSLLGGGETEAEAFRGASQTKAEQAKKGGIATVGQRQAVSERAAGEAEVGQRRGFAEIAQNFLGRFGRSGFGQGVIGSLGEATLQTVGRIRTGLQETVNELNIRRDQLEDVFNSAIQESNFQAENLKQQARSSLQQALADIGSRRAELQTRRGEMVNQALQLYRQNVIDVNTRNVAFQQQLATMREQTNQRIQEAQARAQQNLSTLPSFELSAGQTKFLPLSQVGGQTGAQQLEGTQLPGGVQFGTGGGFGIFSKPKPEEENPFGVQP